MGQTDVQMEGVAQPATHFWQPVIAVIYDAASVHCATALKIVRARETSLPIKTVKLVAWPSREANSHLAEVDERLREINLGVAHSMQDQIVAVLPSGVALANCQSDVMQLVAEMEYMAMVQPPLPRVILQLKHSLNPVQKLHSEGVPGQWWRSGEAIAAVADCMENVHVCILDDFLPHALVECLAAGIKATKPPGPIPAEGCNGWTRGGTARAAEAMQSGGSVKARSELLARTLMNPSRGDVLRFADNEGDMPGTEGLFEALDALVMGLKSCPQVAQRLCHTDFANSAMFTVYPGKATRYIKHTDNSALTDGRRMTAILYLNREWEPAHGGMLRIFEPTMQSLRVKMDVEPLWNRLLTFWSTEEVPHEVLPSYSDRAAVSVWYVCGRESLHTEDAFKRLVSKVRCIGDQDRAERLAAAAETMDQRRVLEAVAAKQEEGRAILAAAAHDFAGCHAYRAQRQTLNFLFGWDKHSEEVQRNTAETQQSHAQLFKLLGLPHPPGLGDVYGRFKRREELAQPSIPHSCERRCDFTGVPAISTQNAAKWQSGHPLPLVFEMVD